MDQHPTQAFPLLTDGNGQAQIELVEIPAESEARIVQVHFGSGDQDAQPFVSGRIHDVTYGNQVEIRRVIVHVVNFRDFLGHTIRDETGTRTRAGRAVIESDGWKFTLDRVPLGNKYFEGIKNARGYGITHAGQVERADCQPFSGKQANEFMEAVYRYLSFCNGSSTRPILAVGFDSNGDRVFERWTAWGIEPSRRLSSWFSETAKDCLISGFPGFESLYRNEIWHEPIHLSIFWYMQANKSAGGVEGAVILAQAALELLGWTRLVEEKKCLSEKGYTDLPAMDKIRLLISSCGIPSEIPAGLSALTAKAKEFQWHDGPQAIVECRNAFVHSSPKKRRRIYDAPTEIRLEAWRLSMWYLELIILNTIGYRGQYSNRLITGVWRGEEVERVPWA